MNRVESISLPRSGHALTTELLQAYFGPSFVYSGEWPGPGNWTEGVHFQKNHDFDLDTPILQDRWYLVQVRDVFDAMWSWQQMTVRQDGVPDTVETFREIFRAKLNYWSRFLEKWVLSDIPNRVILRYRDLVNNPAHSLGVAIQAFGETPQCGRVYEAVKSVKIAPRGMPELYL